MNMNHGEGASHPPVTAGTVVQVRGCVLPAGGGGEDKVKSNEDRNTGDLEMRPEP